MSADRTIRRDRVLDLVKTSALLVVVVGHSLAWDLTDGEPGSVLQARPSLGVVTWLFQLLPLFFAAGAVTNLACWHRYRDGSDPHPARAYQQHRLVRLATPAVVYSLVWTSVGLVAAAGSDEATAVGKFLSQLTWFLGVYTLVVIAVPLSARGAERPWPTLGVGLALILSVDLLRWQVVATAGWVNFVLVWGWLHQLGYHLPGLRQVGRWRLLGAAAAAFGTAVLLTVLGPYAPTMVSVTGEEKMSNLSPPTVVLALVGLAQVLVLAAAWSALARVMQRARWWWAVAAVGSRSIGIYLWHIPLVGLVAVAAWWAPWQLPALSWAWWLAHVLGLAGVFLVVWPLAGLAGDVDRAWERWGSRLRPRVGTTLAVAAVPLVILNASVTGYATWWGPGLFGLPSSSLLNMLLLLVAWRVVVAQPPASLAVPVNHRWGRSPLVPGHPAC